MKKFLIGTGVVVALIVGGAACSGGEESATPEPKPSQTQQVEETPEPEKTVEETPEPVEAPEPTEAEGTVSQQAAVQSAESYLDFMGFSKDGLIEQLSSDAGEGFSKADAEYAVAHVDVDWNEEAAQSAKSYMEMGGFSRASLIEQLVFEKFTPAQAEYGVSKTGL